jgi:predicted alpha/beta hydrolase family esterase
MTTAINALMVPGLFNSGPAHWQTLWEKKHPEYRRVVQRDWETPDCTDWIRTLDQSIASVGPQIVFVAHSLGCATVAHWSAAFRHPILGALLVAPSDVEAPTYPPGTTGFSPMPSEKLPFRSIVVASKNDRYVTLDRARQFAAAWGSEFHDIGTAGHINTDAGFGEWPAGEKLLQQLCD